MRGPIEYTYDALARSEGEPSYAEQLAAQTPDELQRLGRVHILMASMGTVLTPLAFQLTKDGYLDVESTSHPAIARTVELAVNTVWKAPGAIFTTAFAAMAVEGAIGYIRTRRRRNQLNEVE